MVRAKESRIHYTLFQDPGTNWNNPFYRVEYKNQFIFESAICASVQLIQLEGRVTFRAVYEKHMLFASSNALRFYVFKFTINQRFAKDILLASVSSAC